MAADHEQGALSSAQRERAWLAALLLRRQNRLMPRFALALARLRALSRGQRRRLQRRAAATMASTALVLAIGAANFGPIGTRPALAATITVADGEIAVNDNGICSLIEAIINANDGAQTHDDCAAGDAGADTISLPANGTFNFSAAYVYDDGNNGLPTITTEMTIQGNGSTLDLGGSAAGIRLARVDATGDLTVVDTTVSGGYMFDATFGGGVFRVDGGDVALSGSTLEGNGTRSYGGAVFVSDGGELTITNGSTITGNFAFRGGGVYSRDSDVTLSDSSVSGNYAERSGGGVQASHGSLTVTASTVNDNGWEPGQIGVSGYVDYGGGVLASRTNLNITTTTIDGNYSDYGGGGVWVEGTDAVTISQSAITNNVADSRGGGVRWGSTPDGIPLPATGSITNTTISGNEAGDGGGVMVYYGELTLNNVTISDNSAAYYGGGVVVYDTLILNRTIISGNSGGSGAEVFVYQGEYGGGTVTANNFNLLGHSGLTNAQAFDNFTPGATDITATSDGTDPTALASILAALADNGGPTTPATETHALVLGSPAIDGAPSAACAAAPVSSVDQRDAPRSVDGDGAPSANECDIGAYEAAHSPPVGICSAPDNELTTILGVGMGDTKKVKKVAKLIVPNAADVVSLYGQLVGKQVGPASKHVRFFYPNGTFEQVDLITAPSPQQSGIFWYGAALDPAANIRGKWFMRPGKAKAPRAFLLYATHQTPDTYFNTYALFDDGATNQVAGGDTWDQTQTFIIPIDPPTGPADVTVQVALVDNDKDSRAITVSAAAGAATDSDVSTQPTHGPTLNLVTLTLLNVAEGTDEVVITLETDEMGDSAAVVGAAVNYACDAN